MNGMEKTLYNASKYETETPFNPITNGSLVAGIASLKEMKRREFGK